MKAISLTFLLLFINELLLAQTDTISPEQLDLIGCIEVAPSYPGGLKAMKKLVADSMQYPKEAEKHGLGGKVVISYMIDTFGHTTHIKVYKSGGKAFDEEAVRLIGLLNCWRPATLNDRKIVYHQSQPFVFVPAYNRLQKKTSKKQSLTPAGK